MSQLNFTSDLHEDAKNGNVIRVKRALDRGTPVNARKEGYTALHRACQAGQVTVVKLLIERGADINARTFGYYGPIHWAASAGHKEIIEILIEAGADTTAPLQNGKLAYQLAQEEGHKEISVWLEKIYSEASKTQTSSIFEHETLRQQASGYNSSAPSSLELSDDSMPTPSDFPLSSTTPIPSTPTTKSISVSDVSIPNSELRRSNEAELVNPRRSATVRSPLGSKSTENIAGLLQPKKKSPFPRRPHRPVGTTGSAIVRSSRDVNEDGTTSLPVLPREAISEDEGLSSRSQARSPRPKFSKFWKKRTS